MSLEQLELILKSRLVCASEYEIHKTGDNYKLNTTFKNGYLFEHELKDFNVNIDDLINFIVQFKEDYNISVNLIIFNN